MTTELDKARLYLSEAHAFFDFMNEARRKLDDKIYNMITLSGALITIVFGMLSFIGGQKIAMSLGTLGFAVVSGCSFLVAIGFGLIAYKPSKIATRNIREVIKKYELGKDESALESPMRHIAWNLSQDAERNADIVKRKGKWFRRMLYAFFFGLICLIVGLALITQ